MITKLSHQNTDSSITSYETPPKMKRKLRCLFWIKRNWFILDMMYLVICFAICVLAFFVSVIILFELADATAN